MLYVARLKGETMSRNEPIDEFIETIRILRAPGGCEWDRAQTHESIARNMIEEAYEAVDAIQSGDRDHLREELGDVLLQVILQSQMAEDAGEFTFDDVCRDINEKMHRRHPHVFGNQSARTPDEAYEQWERIKEVEKKDAEKNGQERFLDGVPRSFPALMQAQKISKKVIGIGFEWESIDDVWDVMLSEIAELRDAYAQADKDERGRASDDASVALEVGDVLFTFVNVALKMGIDAETALRMSCHKFRNRWNYIEGAARVQGRAVSDLSVQEMNVLWDEAKQVE